jgi:uncharacterized membrane protein
MSSTLIQYLATAIIFGLLDLVWLSSMYKPFYKPQLGALMREPIAVVPSIVFYVIYAVTLTFLIVAPNVAANTPSAAFVQGLVFGLAAYATYNFTNAATLKNWPKLLTLIDLTWGTLATGTTAGLAVLAVHFVSNW